MILLLIAASIIYLLLGDLREALVLFASIGVVIGISLYQNHKTERALDALKDLASPRALVIRDGGQRRIPGREVVRDDVVILAEGDRVPADALLLSGTSLQVDESLLTGESVPVRKTPAAGPVARARPGGDDQPHLYASTMVVRGEAVARVTATGGETEVGRIGRTLQSIGRDATRLQRETRRAVRILATVGLAICVLVVVVYGAMRGDWLRAFLAGLALAMSILPEEFPIVLTIFLALGAWRISQKRVLTRRVAAIESLGRQRSSACKTGTLTMNRWSCAPSPWARRNTRSRPTPRNRFPAFHEVVEYAILASQEDPRIPWSRLFDGWGAAPPSSGTTFTATDDRP
jgi:Ca2+-transporting ATPase